MCFVIILRGSRGLITSKTFSIIDFCRIILQSTKSSYNSNIASNLDHQAVPPLHSPHKATMGAELSKRASYRANRALYQWWLWHQHFIAETENSLFISICLSRYLQPQKSSLKMKMKRPLTFPFADSLTHVCWTKMMFFELPKGWDGYFLSPDNVLVQGICVLKSNPCNFGYFWPKIGQKHLWKPHKRLGLVWSWFGCYPRSTITCLNKKK